MNSSTVAKTVIILSFLSVFLALVGLFVSGGSRAEGTEQWHPLSEMVSDQQLTEIVANNTSPSAERVKIEKSAIGMSRGDLLVVDFETPQLCGRGGCAIAGYRLSTGEQILFTYALQAAGEPIVEFVERPGVNLPCLLIAPPLNSPAQGLSKDTLCYRDSEWITETL